VEIYALTAWWSMKVGFPPEDIILTEYFACGIEGNLLTRWTSSGHALDQTNCLD
jgi:hypothetical protein